MATLPPALIQRLTDSASKIHPDKLEAFSRKLGQGKINTPERFALEVGNRVRPDLLREICDAWREASAITGIDIGNTLLTVATLTRAYSEMHSSLVATRPWDNTNCRTDSETAYLTVIGNARKRLILASYVVYNVQSILDALKEAAARGVHIEVLLEPAQTSGGTIQGAHSSEALLRSIIPNAIFYRPDQGKIRAMHAKFVCADRKIAFITSANLTTSAISRNIELGVMICHGPIPKQVEELFDELIRKQTILPT